MSGLKTLELGPWSPNRSQLVRARRGRQAFRAILPAVAISLAMLGAPASAAIITWTLQDVTFDDGGTASGYFDYDTTSGDAVAFDISVTAGTTRDAFHYEDSTATFFGQDIFSPNSQMWHSSNVGLTQYIILAFTGSLATPGSVAIAVHTPKGPDEGFWPDGPSQGSWECNADCSGLRGVTGGSVVSTAVPEPSAWAMMLLGFFGAGAVVRGSRRVSQPA